MTSAENLSPSRPGGIFGRACRVLPILLCVAFLAYWLAGYAIEGLKQAIVFNGYAADGAFQIFNPLRRIADGQRGGIDFQFFHGLGIPYLHYPLYWLFGKSIHASELARYLTSITAYVGAYLFVFAAAARRLKATLLLFVGAVILSEYFLTGSLVMPCNSLIGLRSTLPLFLYGLLLLRMRELWRSVLVGLALAASFIFGTEHGIAIIGAYVAVHVALLIKVRFYRQQCWSLALVIVSMLAGGAAFYLLIGGPEGLGGAIRYNLVEAPGDQFWYFGGPPNPFLHSFRQFLQAKNLFYPLILDLMLLAVFARLLLRAEGGQSSRFVTASIVLLLYGLLSCVSYLGINVPFYIDPLKRVLVVVGLLGCFELVKGLCQESLLARQIRTIGQPCLLLFVLMVLVRGVRPGGDGAYQGLYEWSKMAGELQSLREAVVKDGWQLGRGWQEQLDRLTTRISEDRKTDRDPFTIFSTFAGLLEAHYGIFHPDTDYLIHALGPRRRQAYLDKFREVQPDYVQTLRKSYFGYEEWLRSTNWEFYEDVCRNYEVLEVTSSSLLWKRRPGAWRSSPAFAQTLVAEAGADIEIPVKPNLPENTLAVIEVEYSVQNAWQSLPVLGRLPRYLLVPIDTVTRVGISLPPYRTSHRFPLTLSSGRRPVLNSRTSPLFPGSGFRMERISWRYLDPKEAEPLVKW